MSNDGFNRRRFLEFMGRSSAGISATLALPNLMSACAHTVLDSNKAASEIKFAEPAFLPFKPLRPSSEDKLLLADGFQYRVLASWGDSINHGGELFGYDNDFTAFTPLSSKNVTEGILWVNHEAPIAGFLWRQSPEEERSRAQVQREQASVGGSLIHIKQDKAGAWHLVKNSSYNRRISGLTRIPFASSRPIANKTYAIGTLGNCAGGSTPWGTVLTCEENYQDYYGEIDRSSGQAKFVLSDEPHYWHKQFDYSPEHYGWVVEVEPKTGKARKLVAMGRFSRESATVTVAKDGRAVVYSGDDGKDRCLYKYIAHKPGDLAAGTLYVADFVKGQWVPVDFSKHKILQKHFKDQLDVMIRIREAAPLIGGTALDRPEDIEIDPISKAIIVSLTNNVNKQNYFGSLLRVVERGSDPLAMEFEAKTFLAGGLETGFACPDNLVFDKRGNLWMTNDVSDRAIGQGPYAPFKNNGLFYIPMSGADAGKVFQVASAPVGSELTGPSFSPDGRTLFISVQHPGAGSKNLKELVSHWPGGGTSIPKPSVVTIQGPSLDQLVS